MGVPLRPESIPPTRRNTDSAFPRLYNPDEVATVLGCSAWWVKDRARRRLIPHTRVGRAYRFTSAHLTEIIRLNEERPAPMAAAKPSTQPFVAPRTSPQNPTPSEPAATTGPRLRARPPRRTRRADFDTAA
ncbi:helix-turn-helix domain-containing protein [Streptomyces sp. B-S-A8]|uniref:Helix-turn-helix domain-containing protein n=1 Tax=Streptomyces solicavernae TaxID=3043614 RepID=A0ABT6S0L7_9ACTN|nr:helix-turn-helix domain-containing protein [Streptomyces sp. B-S-A8]MDI3390202.1 helix-turn-helix domain-containing protein [Streptomyces sp. B-S-A8]